MAEERRCDEDAVVTEHFSASNSHSAVLAAGSIQNQQDTRKSKEDGTNTVPYYKLFSFADSMDYLLMSVGTIGAIGNGLCVPLMTVLFGHVINSFGETTDHKKVGHAILKAVINYLYLAMGAAVTSFLQMSCWMITAERQAARIRNLYLKTMLRQEVGFFDKETNTGEIIGRMSGNTVLIQEAMGEKVGSYIQLIATFSGGFAIAFTKGWLLTVVLLSALPPLVLSGAAINIAVGKLASRGQIAYSGGANVVEQTIGSIRTVASFTGEKQAITKYNKSLTKAYKAGVREGLLAGFNSGSHMFITICSLALALWYGGKLILEKGYKGGEIMNVIFAVVIGAFSLGQASPRLSAFSAGQAAAYKVFETINRMPEIDAYDTSGVILEDIHGDIELRDVHFSYPARPDEKIFQGFSLSITSGATAALVGQSGSGKSTVISLLERFYDPHAGQVLIDGINLKEFQLKWIRQKIGLVSQEPVLFTCSIRENIAYGKDGATTEEIRAAAELANAAKFIDKLPQGLDTMVGEHGCQLSGGQKQRVAIARAIIKNPRILLLDEATSALDAESERTVQEALNKIMINRTTVIVAHRLSTIQNADTIVVIQNGNIAEKGPHCELIKDPDGAYSQLIRFQNISCESEQTTEESLLRIDSSLHSYSDPTGISTLEPDIPASPPSESVKTPGVSLRRLANLHKPEIPLLLLGTLAAAVCGVLLPIFGSFVSDLIKIFFEPPDQLSKDSKFWSAILIVLGVAFLLAHPLRAYLFAVAGCKLIRRVRSMCFEKVVHMEVGWFDEDNNSSAAIGARLSIDAANVRGLVGDALSLIVQSAATVFAGLVIALSANWQLSLIVLVMLPLLGVNEYFQVQFKKGFSADAKKMYADASQVAHDAVGSIRTVASFCAEEKVIDSYQKKCEAPVKAGIRQGFFSGIGFGVSFFSIFFVHACTYFAGGQLVTAGKAEFSQVFRVFFAIIMMATGVSSATVLAPDVRKGKGAAARMFSILDKKSKIDSSDESGTTIQDVKGEIELHHLSFKYPTRSNVSVLHDLCLTVPHGKTVALVGESGSGKSTVIALLQRFYDPDRGHITLDGIDIQKLQLKWLRQQMGLVSQEPVLFNDTIRANIAYGKDGIATEDEILAAAKLANAHQFISSLQQGYDTIAGERGIQLSGGQKQRVAIARAILKAPKILLLDEATSALDAESEQVVQDALDRVMVDRTTVVVAHRLSTIKDADLIAVVKDGVVAEQGKHETLINIKDGIYTSLVSPLQAKESSSLSQ